MGNRLYAFAVFIACVPGFCIAADKPRTRATAEDRAANLARYKLGGFGANATATLGVDVKYVDDQQGATILGFEQDSTAKNAGFRLNDVILEVDGAPVGKLRNRYYELWPQYGRSGTEGGKYLSEVLVSYVHSDGDRRYYFPMVSTQKVTGPVAAAPLDPAFFTSEKPLGRGDAENREKNTGRYVFGYGNFETFGKYELGVTLSYSYQYGGTIQTIKDGGAAQRAGFQVGDHILETAGAPVGQFGDRLYEVWRQYVYDTDGGVEFLICFTDPSTGEFRYYYPEIALDKHTSEN